MANVKTSSKECTKCDHPQRNIPTFLLDAPKREFKAVLCPTHLHEKLRGWEVEEAAEKERKKDEEARKKAATSLVMKDDNPNVQE